MNIAPFLRAVNALAERVNMELPTIGYNHNEKVERDIKSKSCLILIRQQQYFIINS